MADCRITGERNSLFYGRWKTWLLALLLLSGNELSGQINPFSNRSSGGGSREQGEVIERPDTSGLFRYYATEPNLEYAFRDSTLHSLIQQYDPARRQPVDYAHLGILGSAARPIRFRLPDRQGFHVGFHQYDLYRIPFDSIPFFRLGRAYTDLSYAQGATQSDGFLQARFGRNFGSNLSLNADYNRISHLGERNQFPNQQSRVTAMGVGIFFRTKSQRYSGFLAFATNIIEQENNGGVAVEPEATEEFGTPQSAEVFLTDSRTRFLDRTFGYTHHFSLTAPAQRKRDLSLTHQITYRQSSYKTFDEFPNGRLTDTAFYNRFPDFLVDARGVRMQIRHNRIENRFYLSFSEKDPGGPFKPKRQKGLFRVGLRHNLNYLTQEPVDTLITNLFLEGEAAFTPSDRLQVRARGHLGLLDNGGDYRVAGELDFKLGNFVELFAEVENQLVSPNWIQHRLILTGTEIWRRNFNKSLSTFLGGGLAFPRLGLKVEVGYHLLNNYLYFDSLGLSQQSGAPISVFQLSLFNHLRIWNFHLESTLAAQRSTNADLLRVPELFGKHSLYYRGRWFRVLNVKVGFDLRYTTRFFPDYYHPLSGQFILQSARAAEFYPSVDAFLALRVTKFRAVIKWENLDRAFIEDSFFYLTGFYPVPTGPGIRLALSWRFEN